MKQSSSLKLLAVAPDGIAAEVVLPVNGPDVGGLDDILLSDARDGAGYGAILPKLVSLRRLKDDAVEALVRWDNAEMSLQRSEHRLASDPARETFKVRTLIPVYF